jgi:hypothetical protein
MDQGRTASSVRTSAVGSTAAATAAMTGTIAFTRSALLARSICCLYAVTVFSAARRWQVFHPATAGLAPHWLPGHRANLRRDALGVRVLK